MLETDPEAVLISEDADARLRAPLERNLGPLVERLVEAEMRRIMASGSTSKQLVADDALV